MMIILSFSKSIGIDCKGQSSLIQTNLFSFVPTIKEPNSNLWIDGRLLILRNSEIMTVSNLLMLVYKKSGNMRFESKNRFMQRSAHRLLQEHYRNAFWQKLCLGTSLKKIPNSFV